MKKVDDLAETLLGKSFGTNEYFLVILASRVQSNGSVRNKINNCYQQTSSFSTITAELGNN